MVALLWVASIWANEPNWPRLAFELVRASTEDRRANAAEALRNAPPEALAEIATQVLRTVTWHPDATFRLRGSIPWFAALRLNEPERRQLLTELMAHRVALTVLGRNEVPERLEVELRALLVEEIEALGEPTCTTDWVHLYGAAKGDVAGLIARLGLTERGQWAYVVAEDATVRDPTLRETVSLLGHRSAVVRHRAARSFERRPAEAVRALRHAWRYAPGRVAPLRGDVAVPQLRWSYPTSAKWARTLVRWAGEDNVNAMTAGFEPRCTSSRPPASARPCPTPRSIGWAAP
ncbi:MAG: hypothetical protein AAGA48_30400 [Myxococcota bacterium]